MIDYDLKEQNRIKLFNVGLWYNKNISTQYYLEAMKNTDWGGNDGWLTYLPSFLTHHTET